MGRDRSADDAVNEVGVEVDTSSAVEITISASGDEPITVSVDDGLPADAEPHTMEPRTLEPRLTVRGLSPSAPGSPTLRPPGVGPEPRRAVPSPRKVVVRKKTPPVAGAAEADDDDEDEDDKTALNVEGRLLEVAASEQRARMRSNPGFGPIITPSEPFRATSPQVLQPGTSPLDGAPTAKTLGAGEPLVPSAASRPDTHPSPADPTAPRSPMRSEVEDDAVTDQMRALGPPRVESLPKLNDDSEFVEIDEEVQTHTEPIVALGGGVVGSVPAPLVDDAAPALGGTMRIELPEAGLPVAGSAPRLPATAPMAKPLGQGSFPPPPARLAAPAPPQGPHEQHVLLQPPPPPPQHANSPPYGFASSSVSPLSARALITTANQPLVAPVAARDRARPKKRGSGRVLSLLFLVSIGAAGASLYHSRYRPDWMTLPLPASTTAASSPDVPMASVSAGPPGPSALDVNEDASAATAPTTAAGPSLPDSSAPALPSASSQASAAASSSGSASPGPSAPPTASASSSARGRGRGRPRR